MKKGLLLLAVGIATTQAYQNCGELSHFEVGGEALSMASLGSTDTTHPSVAEPTPPTQKVLTLNREATASMLREIFTSTSAPVPYLDYNLVMWVKNRSPQYGSACNPYDSATGRDCGDIGNANLPIYQDDSTLRESFRTQICENLLGYDQGVNAVLEKITRTSQAPNRDGIAQVYELFYRAEDADPVAVQALIDLDRTLTANSESTTNRWRAVILQICTSTGWQLL